MKCKFCFSKQTIFKKIIHPKRNGGKFLQIKLICLKCKKSYPVKKTGEVYRRTKNLKWVPSDSYKEYLNRMRQAIDAQKEETRSCLKRMLAKEKE
ncbi:MAG TPA: hypothetical protein PLF70_02200 [Candidatus Portnoybacteria bacterium]|nr:hypothetical protein [Candidatus Portnoybacteria bacterium]